MRRAISTNTASTTTATSRTTSEYPSMLSAAALALFGTLSYVAVILSALIVPIFALYLLIDFDRIVVRAPSADALPAAHPARAKIAAAPTGAAAFICVGETCSLPVIEAEEIAEAVTSMRSA